MKLLTCPVNGCRAISEFTYGGEFVEMPDAAHCSDEEWVDFVFNRSGIAGVKREWWCHTASGTWFIAERDTLTDQIQRTYLFSRSGTAA